MNNVRGDIIHGGTLFTPTTERRTADKYIIYEKSTVRLTSVGLAQARPNYVAQHKIVTAEIHHFISRSKVKSCTHAHMHACTHTHTKLLVPQSQEVQFERSSDDREVNLSNKPFLLGCHCTGNFVNSEYACHTYK